MRAGHFVPLGLGNVPKSFLFLFPTANIHVGLFVSFFFLSIILVTAYMLFGNWQL